MGATMDPFATLGVDPGAAPDELAAAYRRAAKRWHPDRGAGPDAQRRMSEINAAYDLLRDGGWRSALAEAAARREKARTEPARRRARGAWLSSEIRQAMGGELIAALKDGEPVVLVTPTSTWASPTAVLAVTDRRLLWLLDDAIGNRTHSLPFDAIDSIEVTSRRLRRDRAAVRLRTTLGRRHAFTELRPETARDVVRRVESSRSALART